MIDLPSLFVASSTEGLAVVYDVEDALEFDHAGAARINRVVGGSAGGTPGRFLIFVRTLRYCFQWHIRIRRLSQSSSSGIGR